MKIYLAGPMRGIPHGNHPAFLDAAQKMRELGHTVFSPVEYDIECGVSDPDVAGSHLRRQILWDLARIAESDAVVLLDGWIHSSGCRLELEFARFLGDVKVYVFSEIFPAR